MDFISEHKRAVFFGAALVCIVVAILTLNYKKPTFLENLVGYIVSPTQEVTNNIGGWISDKINFMSNLNELEQTNKALLAEIEQLKMEKSRLEMVEAENTRLTALVDLKSKYPQLPTVGADVTSTDPNNWSDSFNIDKGRRNGITENMVVLQGGGLVGKIHKANESFSLVVPITDDTSSVGAQNKRTGDVGFVKGNLKLSDSGYCRMENIDLNAQILENDEIITSNLGDIYPPGITIGFVKEIHVDIDGLTKYAIIAPVADLKHLETVLVVKQNFSTTFSEELVPPTPAVTPKP